MSLNDNIKAIIAIGIISVVPIADKYNIVVDSDGRTLHDLIWFLSFYLIMTISFSAIVKLTNNGPFLTNLFFKVCKWLLIGKIIDQIFNPYGYHGAELAWDLGAAIRAVYQYRKWKENRNY